MAELAVLNSKFDKAGSLKVDLELSPESINIPVVHQVVKATLANRRQGNACTKVRSEVSGGGAKPFKQKGTGRARQGSTRSPLMPGGGTAFGPKPRDYSQKLNKKVVLNAIRSVLADKFQAGKLTVIEEFDSNGKTKELFSSLNSRGLLPGLIVTEKEDSLALRAVKNLEHGKGVPLSGFSVYEAVKYENLIIEKRALEGLLERLG
jgi:large subunit ribosomal protein L4